MSLGVGARLGHYSVTAKLGEGGMGEVYRARDTTLDRDVALKVLPDAFASDPERLARFEREGQVLSSPQPSQTSTQIYGIEEANDRALEEPRARVLTCRADGYWVAIFSS